MAGSVRDTVELAHSPPFRLGRVDVRPATREIVAGTRREVLQPRIMQVLVALARFPGEVVTRDDLTDSCWGGRVVGEDAITRVISKLRAAAGPPRAAGWKLETINKVGYRLVLLDEDEAATEAAVPAAPDGPVAIAVLPFENLSSDPEQDYFSEGLSEELIHHLAHIEGLRVPSRRSVLRVRGRKLDLAAVGRELGVGYVLEGGVRKAGDRLRITAQLAKCSDGFQLWSERYDRLTADVFAIQDEIAGVVAGALTSALGVPRRPGAPGGTSNVEAHDLMLRARRLHYRGQAGDAERAEALLRQALDLDPNFALGWTVLGNAFTSQLVGSGPERRERLLREIDAAHSRAIELAPDLWFAHESRANQLELRHDWLGAEAANARSVAAAPPSMREPLVSRAHQLAIVGRVEEALPFTARAIQADPLVPYPTLALLFDLVGRHAEAELESERMRDLSTTLFLSHVFSLWRALGQRDHAAVTRRLRVCADTDRDPNSVYRAMAEVFHDQARARALARGVLEEIEPPDRNLVRVHWAIPFSVHFGDVEPALQALRAMAPDLLGVMILNIWHPMHAELRRADGFKAVLEDLNIAAYWRATGHWGDFARPLADGDFAIIR